MPLKIDQPFSYIGFFNSVGDYLNDTYLLVLMAIEDICLGNYVLKQENLVTELHDAI